METIDIRQHGFGKIVRRVVRVDDYRKVLIIGRKALPKDNPYRQGPLFTEERSAWNVRAIGFAGLLVL